MIENTIEAWHKLVAARDAAGLDNILADHVVFHSPVVHTPQEGKPITTLYLTAALHVLNNDSFKYLREVISGNTAVLEFTTVIEGITINGVDISRVERKGVRAAIAVVMQEPFLYSKTVGENIRFGRAGAPDEAQRVAVPGEVQADRSPDAAAGSGDEGDAIVKGHDPSSAN